MCSYNINMELWRTLLKITIDDLKNYKDGDKYISTRKFCKQHEVSIITCRKVYDKLHEFGLLLPLPRRGYIVTKNKGRRLRSYSQLYLNAVPKIVFCEYREHQSLGKCLYYIKHRYIDNKLYCTEMSYVSTKYLPAKITPQILLEINESLFKMFKQRKLVNIVYAHKQIKSCLIKNKPYSHIINTIHSDFDETIVISNLYEKFEYLNANFSEIIY